MTKSEWGTKRSCLGCGVAFYDMKKSPIVCPKCGEEHDPQPLLKPRRTGPTSKPAAVVEKKAPVEAEETDEDIDLDDAGIVLETDDDDDDLDDDDEDDSLIEDASDLVGGDDDEGDVAEVKEHLDTDDTPKE